MHDSTSERRNTGGGASPRYGTGIRAIIAVSCALLVRTSPVAAQGAGEAPFRFDENVMVQMRDGVKLATNLFLPKDGEAAVPVILVRSPYGKPGGDWGDGGRWVEAGYAVVVQDCRGRGQSEGAWDPFRHDPEDGFDTQEWIGAQPWCNGSIGTSGGSYVGWTQWASAPLGSRFLKAMVPVVPFADAYHDIVYPGGALQIALSFGWGAGMGGIQAAPDRLNEAFSFLPLLEWDDHLGKAVSYLDEWVRNPEYNAYWQRRGIDGRHADIRVPVLNIGGWYDIFSKATIDHVDRVRAVSADPLVRRNQFVIMGPWAHGVGVRKVGDLDFGEAAQLDLRGIERDWFDYWLLGKPAGVEDWPAVKIFVMGENVWRDEHEWPLARTDFTAWYLHGGGRANSLRGDGLLSLDPPGEQPPDTFTYDPADPVPTIGGNNLVGPAAGPMDQRPVEERDDVLVYTGDPLERAVEVTGPVKVVLFASSSAPDTDFTAKLVDVHPDGKAINLCDGIVRASRRNAPESAPPLGADEVVRYDIDLWVTSNLFKQGHRIRVEVSSSNFPRFDRNPNTGAAYGANAELQTATQTVRHDADHPSRILLPVIPR